MSQIQHFMIIILRITYVSIKIFMAFYALLLVTAAQMMFLDNILTMAQSALLIGQHLDVLTHILQCLGFIINSKKSVITTTQKIKFLGMVVNHNSLLVSRQNETDPVQSSQVVQHDLIVSSNGRYLNYSIWVRYEFIPNMITDTAIRRHSRLGRHMIPAQ